METETFAQKQWYLYQNLIEMSENDILKNCRKSFKRYMRKQLHKSKRFCRNWCSKFGGGWFWGGGVFELVIRLLLRVQTPPPPKITPYPQFRTGISAKRLHLSKCFRIYPLTLLPPSNLHHLCNNTVTITIRLNDSAAATAIYIWYQYCTFVDLCLHVQGNCSVHMRYVIHFIFTTTRSIKSLLIYALLCSGNFRSLPIDWYNVLLNSIHSVIYTNINF